MSAPVVSCVVGTTRGQRWPTSPPGVGSPGACPKSTATRRSTPQMEPRTCRSNWIVCGSWSISPSGAG
ncbi:MAG: hypothetical protein MZW92_31965 [Comamonadaceae bacterium]|nr:hypothetical protein [Comamonadaceae bacterium]